jgi:hypothetical protein
MALARPTGCRRRRAASEMSKLAVRTAAVLALAVATLVPTLSSGTTASAANAPQSACTRVTAANIYVNLQSGMPGLKLSSLHLGPRTEQSDSAGLPNDIRVGPLGRGIYVAKACFLPDDTEVSFDYTVTGTSLSVFAHVKVPFVGDNQISCEVRQNGVPVIGSPYFCKTEIEPFHERLKPVLRFTIGPRPRETVTDPERQAALATQFASSCQNGSPACAYKATSRTFLRTENKQISDWFNNCSDSDKLSPEETWEYTSTIENSFNFKVSAETGKILELFSKVTAEVQYNHKWNNTEKYSFKLALPVPAKKMSAWFYAAGYDKIVGDFIFTDNTGGPVYVLPNATVLLPNKSGVRSNPTRPYDPSLCEANPSQLSVLPLRPMFAQ